LHLFLIKISLGANHDNHFVYRILHAVEPVSVIPIASHPYSNEILILLIGKIRVIIYNDQKEIKEAVILDKGDVGFHIPKMEWHRVSL
jgi:WxcM-like, C-terminal.